MVAVYHYAVIIMQPFNAQLKFLEKWSIGSSIYNHYHPMLLVCVSLEG